MPSDVMVSLYEPNLGRLELGCKPYVVESFQIGSPAIRQNSKDRALSDGTFDDTLYYGASAITISTRLDAGGWCSDREIGALRDRLAAYANPRLRPRLQWRYPTDTEPRWATVRGVSWPITISGPKYPTFAVQFTNPLGQAYLGDLADVPNSASASPGATPGGRSYDLSFDRDYPNVSAPAGTAVIENRGNAFADWVIKVNGPFDAGAVLVLGGVVIEFDQAVPANEYIILRTLDKTIMNVNGLSYYPYVNFEDWSWEDVVLPPYSTTTMTFDAVHLGNPSGWATIEWYSTVI